MLYSKEKLKSCERGVRLLLYEIFYFVPNKKLSVNSLITCIIYCALYIAGPGCD